MFQKTGQILIERIQIWQEQLMNNFPNIVAALFALIIFYTLARILKKYIYKIASKFVKKGSLRRLITTFIQFNIIAIGVLIALSVLNLGKVITSLLAGAGVAGLVMGFAMREIISNFFSGVTLATSEPFRLGDLVEIKNILGTVSRIDVRTTEIETPDGQLVEMPNKDVMNNPIINYTTTGVRRIDISSGISYDNDPQIAKKLAIETISGIEGIDKDKPVEFFYQEFGDSSLIFVLRFWMEFGNSNKEYFQLRSEAIEKLLNVYDKNDIVMPYPIKTVKLEKESRQA